ncbi:MAG: flagellar export protein FliJ [Betaproteobacteria bacterium]
MENSRKNLNLLLELAVRDLSQAENRLAAANHQMNESRKQQGLLEQYREDYMSRHQTTLNSGMSGWDLNNYNTFISNLDQAIVKHERVMNEYSQTIERYTKAWQECQKKKRSYEVLIDRNRIAQYKVESRIEQKLMDEFSSNQRRFLQSHAESI